MLRTLLFFAAAGATSLVAGLVHGRLSQPLRPRVRELKLAATAEKVKLILRSWRGDGRKLAAKVITLDYLFLLAYGTAGWALCSLIAGEAAWLGWWHTKTIMIGTAWLFVAGAAFDALENSCSLILIGTVRSEPPRGLPQITAAFSLAKFATLLLAVQILLGAFVGATIDAMTFYSRQIHVVWVHRAHRLRAVLPSIPCRAASPRSAASPRRSVRMQAN